MKKLSALTLLFLTSLTSQAAPVVSTSSSLRGFAYRLEPLIGFEQVYRAYPSSHTVSRPVYGLRLGAGSDKLALEGEYLHGEDSENFSLAPQKITNKDDLFKLGVRSSFLISNSFFLIVRAGAEASRNINETTTNTQLVSVENPFKINPYTGVQLGYRIGKGFNISVGSTVVIKEIGDLTKNDYQNTLSIGIGTN